MKNCSQMEVAKQDSSCFLRKWTCLCILVTEPCYNNFSDGHKEGAKEWKCPFVCFLIPGGIGSASPERLPLFSGFFRSLKKSQEVGMMGVEFRCNNKSSILLTTFYVNLFCTSSNVCVCVFSHSYRTLCMSVNF